MSSQPVLTAVALFTASLLSQAVMAQTSSAPVTRAEVKAETRAAEKAGQLTPAGQGPQFKVSRKSTKTRAQEKAETLAARKAGTLEPAGDAEIEVVDRQMEAQRSTVNRAALKAKTRAQEKAGQLIPAGEGPGAPTK
ncbi:MAG TPA: DUF4148 domain-containing protein [Caldimonas sp.]|jgi:thymidine phosphorylase|nr:DUF4148 domain-containing protein [Caldimonas sp.]